LCSSKPLFSTEQLSRIVSLKRDAVHRLTLVESFATG
jgi:hypothetical protein